MILGLENQANHAIQLMKPILSNNAHTIEIKHEPVVKYNNEVQRALEKTVWNSGGCSSWYITSEGHNSVSYPCVHHNLILVTERANNNRDRCSMIWQTLRFMFPTWSHWRVTWTRRGLLKQRSMLVAKTLLLMVACFTFWSFRHLLPMRMQQLRGVLEDVRRKTVTIWSRMGL